MEANNNQEGGSSSLLNLNSADSNLRITNGGVGLPETETGLTDEDILR